MEQYPLSSTKIEQLEQFTNNDANIIPTIVHSIPLFGLKHIILLQRDNLQQLRSHTIRRIIVASASTIQKLVFHLHFKILIL